MSDKKFGGHINIDLDVEKFERVERYLIPKSRLIVKNNTGLTYPIFISHRLRDKVGLKKCKNYNIGHLDGKAPIFPSKRKRLLWKMLIGKDIMKKDLHMEAGISWATLTKISKGYFISTEELMKVCKVRHCDVSDIVEYIDDGSKSTDKEKI